MSRRGGVESLGLLLTANADVNLPIPSTPYNPSPAHNCLAMAARHGHHSCVKALHEHKADLDATNAIGWGALHEACNMDATESVLTLIEAKCNLNLRTKTGRNAYDLTHDPLLQQILVDAGIETDEVEIVEQQPDQNTTNADANKDMDAKSTTTSTAQESKLPEKEPDSKFRLLGDLPELGPPRNEQEYASRARSGRGKSSRRKKTKGKSKLLKKLRTNNAPSGCPEEFVCDITGSSVLGLPMKNSCLFYVHAR